MAILARPAAITFAAGAVLFWAWVASAALPATMQTTIPAQPGMDTYNIKTNKEKVWTGSSAAGMPGGVPLQFDLRALFQNAKLTSCAVRIVLAKPSGALRATGVLLELQQAGPANTYPLVAAQAIEPAAAGNSVEGGSAVIFRSKQLCEVIAPDGATRPQSVTFRLTTSARDVDLTINGPKGTYAGAEQPAYAPRLILTYKAATQRDDSDWGQMRRDAQHTGRSPWRVYDPDGRFTPDGFTVRSLVPPTELAAVTGPSAVRQSPLMYGGSLLWVARQDSNYRVQSLGGARSAPQASDALTAAPKFLAAGPPGRLYYGSENEITSYDLSESAPKKDAVVVSLPNTETLADGLTVGPDGSLYTVSITQTETVVRGYAPPPTRAELWRSRLALNSAVSAVTLSGDGATAYVLLGGTANKMVALDAATGECRWQQAVPGTIYKGDNDPMPVPVAVGANIMTVDRFGAGSKLFVFGDIPTSVPSDAGETIGPIAAGTTGGTFNCRSNTAPGAVTTLERQEPLKGIPAPVAGSGQEAFYLQGGAAIQLCWWRGPKDTACAPIEGDADCKSAAAFIDRLIGDSSGGKASGTESNALHLYGLDPGDENAKPKRSPRIVQLTIKSPASGMTVACRGAELNKAGPNLILGGDGTLYNWNTSDQLQAIVPTGFSGNADNLTLTPDMFGVGTDCGEAGRNNASVFRAGTIKTDPKLCLPANTDIAIVAGKSISFANGLVVKSGARLRARVGF